MIEGYVIVSKDTGEVQFCGRNNKCFWSEQGSASKACSLHFQGIFKGKFVVVPAKVVPEY